MIYDVQWSTFVFSSVLNCARLFWMLVVVTFYFSQEKSKEPIINEIVWLLKTFVSDKHWSRFNGIKTIP